MASHTSVAVRGPAAARPRSAQRAGGRPPRRAAPRRRRQPRTDRTAARPVAAGRARRARRRPPGPRRTSSTASRGDERRSCGRRRARRARRRPGAGAAARTVHPPAHLGQVGPAQPALLLHAEGDVQAPPSRCPSTHTAARPAVTARMPSAATSTEAPTPPEPPATPITHPLSMAPPWGDPGAVAAPPACGARDRVDGRGPREAALRRAVADGPPRAGKAGPAPGKGTAPVGGTTGAVSAPGSGGGGAGALARSTSKGSALIYSSPHRGADGKRRRPCEGPPHRRMAPRERGAILTVSRPGYQACILSLSQWDKPVTIGPPVDCPRVGPRWCSRWSSGSRPSTCLHVYPRPGAKGSLDFPDIRDVGTSRVGTPPAAPALSPAVPRAPRRRSGRPPRRRPRPPPRSASATARRPPASRPHTPPAHRGTPRRSRVPCPTSVTATPVGSSPLACTTSRSIARATTPLPRTKGRTTAISAWTSAATTSAGASRAASTSATSRPAAARPRRRPAPGPRSASSGACSPGAAGPTHLVRGQQARRRGRVQPGQRLRRARSPPATRRCSVSAVACTTPRSTCSSGSGSSGHAAAPRMRSRTRSSGHLRPVEGGAGPGPAHP